MSVETEIVARIDRLERLVERTATMESTVPGGGSAPANAQYVVLALDATLTAERVLTGTADQIIVTDNGAGSTVVLSLDPNPIITGLTAGRVVIVSASKELTDDADFTFDGSQLALAVQGSTGGLLVGGDAQWYRSAADVWRTPDAVTVDSTLTVIDANSFIFTSAAGLVINDGGGTALDVRMEGDTNANLLMLDASVDQVGVGTATMASFAALTVVLAKGSGTYPASQIALGNTVSPVSLVNIGGLNWGSLNVNFYWDGDADSWKHFDTARDGVFFGGSTSAANGGKFYIYYGANGAGAITPLEIIQFSGGAGVVINDTSDPAVDFRVESDGDANAIFLDASADQLSFFGASNGAKVTVWSNAIGTAAFIIANSDVSGGTNVSEFVTQYRTTTTNNTQTTLATITAFASHTMLLEAWVTARRTGGTSGAAEDGAGYVIRGTYKNVAGTATLIGAVNASYTGEDQAGWDATFTVSGGNVLLRVTGATNNNVSWHATVRSWKLSS